MHPYASLMPPIIANLKRIRDALKVAKQSAEAGDAGVRPKRERKARPSRNVNLGLIGIGGQALVEPGEGLASHDPKSFKGDPIYQRLMYNYMVEVAKCAERRNQSQGNGSVRLPDGSIVAAPRRQVSIPCPGATAAANELSKYFGRASGAR